MAVDKLDKGKLMGSHCMGVAVEGLDEARLHNFSLLNNLAPELLEEVIANSTVERVPPGRRIFSEQDDDKRTIFLLTGQLALLADGHAVIILKADSREAHQPVAEQKPRQVTAVASTSATIMSIDSDLLNRLVVKNMDGGATTPEMNDDLQRHMQQLFQNPLFGNLPQPHQHVLMRRMVEVKARLGDVIINEGDLSEYYHMIIEGSCRVSRKIGGDAEQQIIIADLNAGSGFGEGALIENDIHDSSVTMTSDGVLLRLSKGEFLTLLVKPFINWLSYEETLDAQQQGAVLLDVRSPTAYQRSNLPGSINLPLIVLRKVTTILDGEKKYIVCCDIGRRSSTAAFLLAEQGINVNILEGGVRRALA